MLPIEIGLEVSVGGKAAIDPGKRIWVNSVIGAGSMVIKHKPEGDFAVGNSCRVIREICR